jgi:hypothetical protein
MPLPAAKLSLPALLAIAAMLGASPAWADAITYKGTLGKTPIVVELSGEIATAKQGFAGRYFYPAKGIDIPLDAGKVAPGKVDLSEEKPCTADTCHGSIDDTPPAQPPLGAQWHLESNADGTITGTWQDGGKSLPVTLQRFASRPLNGIVSTPGDLAAIAGDFLSGEKPLTAKASPYDFLKMQVPLTESAETKWGDAGFKYVTDPRTKFRFPRITSLAGGDPAAANAFLAGHHWSMNLDALSCEAQQYQGLGWNESLADSAGTLGGYEDEQVEVTYLSPTLMSWTEAGSLFCGGAHPDNHRNNFNLAVKSGKPLDLSRIFAGWVPTAINAGDSTDLAAARAQPDAYSWGPDQQLADFVRAHRTKSDAATESDCGFDDLIGSNLAVGFVNGDKVVFGLGELPNVIEACADDLYTAPIAELKPLLTPEAAAYFPSLKTAK